MFRRNKQLKTRLGDFDIKRFIGWHRNREAKKKVILNFAITTDDHSDQWKLELPSMLGDLGREMNSMYS